MMQNERLDKSDEKKSAEESEENVGREPRVGETGRRHPVTPPGVTSESEKDSTDGITWRDMDELGGDNENHSRKQGIGYGRGSSKGSRNDHIWNSTDNNH